MQRRALKLRRAARVSIGNRSAAAAASAMETPMREIPYGEHRNFRSDPPLLSGMRRSESTLTEAGMLRDQVISFLECTIIFLLLTNAISVAAAAYAISVATRVNTRAGEARAVVMSKAGAVLTAMWPRSSR
jgi:hypothetical protein